MPFVIIFLLVIVTLIFYVIAIYNKLVKLKNAFKTSFAQIEVQLKRRYDLIPNLIETAKGYLKHESETLEAIVSARNAASQGLSDAAANPANADLMKKFISAESSLGSALGKFNVVVEAYPDLKANQNMMQLSSELSETEDKIALVRQHYNNAVMNYNVYKQSFPNNMFAGMFGHSQDATLLEFEDTKQIQQAPKVQF